MNQPNIINPISTPGSAQPTQKKKGCGCFFYGCLSVVVLFLIGLGTFYYLVMRLTNYVTDLAAEQPIRFAALDQSPERYIKVKEKVEQFATAANSGTPTTPLELSGEELNLLTAYNPGMEQARDYYRINISDSAIRLTVSYPLAEAGIPGRYLNGEAIFRVSVVAGTPSLFLDSLRIGDKDIPESIMQQLRDKNFAEELKKEELDLSLIKSLSIEGNHLRIVPADRAPDTLDKTGTAG